MTVAVAQPVEVAMENLRYCSLKCHFFGIEELMGHNSEKISLVTTTSQGVPVPFKELMEDMGRGAILIVYLYTV